MCIWTALISQTKAKSIQFNTKFQMYTKTADFKFTQYIFNTNICAQTANFIGDISNFLNITEYRCAYMQITEAIFFFYSDAHIKSSNKNYKRHLADQKAKYAGRLS